MMNLNTFYIVSIFVILKCVEVVDSEQLKKTDLKEEVLPPCQACKTFIKTFIWGYNMTAKNFPEADKEPGETLRSKERLRVIKDNMCSNVIRGQKQCLSLIVEWNYILEKWWEEREESPDNLFEWFCIKNLGQCCPENHFGPDCKPCEGFPNSICSNNGKCKGSGTRKGNGECLCNEGYSGSKCDSCAKLYYESYKDDDKLLCSKCHPACRTSCTSSGPKSCNDCSSGWLEDPDHGCLDINECATLSPCKKNEFCINTEGSFSCLACDLSCDGCHGDGPDMCKKCALGFYVKDGICTQRDRDESLDYGRYFTYLGLCVATCIIFQKNTTVASIIGLSVAVYVSVSEYWLQKLK